MKTYPKKDFLISYSNVDREIATWIAWEVEDAGFSVLIEEWDFRGNFVLAIDRAQQETERTMAILSPDYLVSMFTQPEWAARFAQDPDSGGDRLIPVRVRDVKLHGLLAQIVCVDIFNLNEDEARERILSRVRGQRLKPSTKPRFPQIRLVTEKPVFLSHSEPMENTHSSERTARFFRETAEASFNEEIGKAALDALVEYFPSHPDTEECLFEVIRGAGHQYVRAHAIRILADRFHKAVRTKLLLMRCALEEQVPFVRLTALIEIVKRFRELDHQSMIAKFFLDQDECWAPAIRGFATVHRISEDKEIARIAFGRLYDTDTNVRVRAAKFIGFFFLRHPKALGLLCERASKDKDERVRVEATCSWSMENCSKIEVRLLREDLGEYGRCIDPNRPIDKSRVSKAAQLLKTTELDVISAYEGLAKRFPLRLACPKIR